MTAARLAHHLLPGKGGKFEAHEATEDRPAAFQPTGVDLADGDGGWVVGICWDRLGGWDGVGIGWDVGGLGLGLGYVGMGLGYVGILGGWDLKFG